MSNVNLNYTQLPKNQLEVQKNIQNQESYTGLDKEQLKQDAVQIGKKVQNNAKENFLFRAMRDVFGVKDPKKALKSVLYTVLTVVGLAVLGNKISTPSAKLGEKVDDILLGEGFAGKAYQYIGNIFQSIKNGISKLPKPKFVHDLADTMKNRRLNMQFSVFRGYEKGPVGIFLNTLRDSFKFGPLAGRDEIIEKSAGELAQIAQDLVPDAAFTNKIDDLIDIANQCLNKADDAGKAKITDIITELTGRKNADNKFIDLLTSLVGDKTKAQGYFDEILQGWQNPREQKFYSEFIQSIADNLGSQGGLMEGKSKVEILEALSKNALKDKGLDVSSLIDITMKAPASGGIVKRTAGTIINLPSDWWPVTVIESIGRKFNPDFKFCRGNLFDSLIKFNAINQTGAKTIPGKLIQKIPTLSTESISNFVNDKSGMGVFLCIPLMNEFNRLQDAPKDKKFATGADSFIGQICNWAIAMPLTYKAVYSLASLKNLEGKGPVAFMLKQAGKIFGLGLGTPNQGFVGKMKGIGGGAFRFFLFMFVFSPLVSKGLKTVMGKIFGKPYDAAQEAKNKQIEEQKKQIIPELGITQGEFMEKLQKNPNALTNLQNNPALTQKIQQNPKLLLDLLDGKDITNAPASPAVTPNMNNQGSAKMSPLNASIINASQKKQTAQNQAPNIQTNNQMNQNNFFKTTDKTQKETPKTVDSATYIPSSDYIAKTQTLSEEKQTQYDELLSKSDKILKKAEKYI